MSLLSLFLLLPTAMGNCFQLQITNRNSSSHYSATTNTRSHEKVLKVVKTDGNILEYKRAMLVKDILMNFSASCGIVLSQKPLEDLPHNYKLKNISSASGSTKPMAAVGDSQTAGTAKRIKLIVTNKELQEFLSKKMSVEEMLLLAIKRGDHASGRYYTSSRWHPLLQTIPEVSKY